MRHRVGLAEDEVLRALPFSSLLIDRDWHVTFMDEALAVSAGVRIADVIGTDLRDAFSAGMTPELAAAFERAMVERSPVHLEVPGRLTRRWNALDLQPVADGGVLCLVQDISDARRTRHSEERLLAEHALLARVAGAVARSTPPAALFELVCTEIAGLLGVDFAGVGRTAGPGRCEVVASWSGRWGGGRGLGFYDLEPTDEFERLRRTDAPVWSRTADESMSRHFSRLGLHVTYAVPIRANGRLWGLLLTGAVDPARLDETAGRRQQDLCELLGLAIANAQAREELVVRATTDSLTGLTNHRTFHERLDRGVADAARGGEALSVAVFDLDAFRAVNEALGHAAGDRLLAAAAGALERATRPGDVVARLGGDEFGVILPGVGKAAAAAVVDRARRAVADAASAAVQAEVSVSAGVCDVTDAPDAARLFELADGALYWAKGHGRDATCVFDADVVQELNAAERVEGLERSKVLLGIGALAKAIDAKDAATRRHAERVARLAGAVAGALGRPRSEVDRLEQAALVHDVGKIGVPDSILLKPGRLGEEELRRMRDHAALGARMVEGVLDDDQVRWIRNHHERPDGRGYPDGLTGPDLDLATAVLSLCDAWDVMLSGRPYQAPQDPAAVMAECERLVGHQFLAEPVAAMRALHASGALAQLL